MASQREKQILPLCSINRLAVGKDDPLILFSLLITVHGIATRKLLSIENTIYFVNNVPRS